MSDSLHPHGLRHTRLPCPSPTPRACSNSCPLSWWCYPTIWSSVIHFSSCLQSFPASGSFPMSQFFTSGGQSSEASALVLLINIQDWFPLGLTGLIPLAVQGTLKNISKHGLQAWLCDFPWTTECEHKNRMFHKQLLLLLSSQSEKNTEHNHN